MRIVGVGFDTPAANEAWAQDQGFQYELWSDDDKTLALHHGAVDDPGDPTPARVTVLLDCEGHVLLEYLTVSASQHPGQVLADCEELFGAP